MLTRHGEKRIARRAGVGKRGAEKLADEALAEGTPRDDTKGKLRRYLDSLYFQHGPTFIAVHHGAVYIFGSKAGPLITTFSLPGNLKHRKAARA